MNKTEERMIPHRINTKMGKNGTLELEGLPFKEGSEIEIVIVEKEYGKRKENLRWLLENDHIWSEDDIDSVLEGRDIINSWKLS